MLKSLTNLNDGIEKLENSVVGGNARICNTFLLENHWHYPQDEYFVRLISYLSLENLCFFFSPLKYFRGYIFSWTMVESTV